MNIRRVTTFRIGKLIVASTAVLALVIGCGGAGNQTPDTFALSGTVLDEGGDPISGVQVSFAGADTPAAVVTDEDGHWEKAGLWGDVTVTADDPAYTFVSGTRSVSAGAADVDFDGVMKTCNAGDRTDPIDPCVITRIKQVQKIQEQLDGHYALGADVDASSTESWSGGVGFEPLGSQAASVFTGSLDGRDFEIRGLFIDRESADEVGLFGYIGSAGEVSNLSLVGGSVSGREYVGAIAGISHGVISSSHNSGSVTGDKLVGGVVGSNYGTIEDASNTGDVGGGVRLGGLAGANEGSIKNSFNAGDVVGDQRVGGIAGLSYRATIERSHNSGRIEGGNTVGGIVGSQEGLGSVISTSYNRGAVVSRGTGGGLAAEVWNGTIEDSYNLGAVTGSVRAGGVVGLLEDDGTSSVRRTFNAGVVQGATDAGGVVALQSAGSIDHSYFDVDESPGMDDEGSYGRSTTDMMQQSTYAPAWDFGTVWSIDDGNDYPDLIDNPR